MKHVRILATNLGMGIGLVYGLFLWEPIYSLFPNTFIVLIRQIMVLSFGVCIIVNPEGMLRMGERIAPKLISIISILFGTKKKDDES